jgi:hypothetical protein
MNVLAPLAAPGMSTRTMRVPMAVTPEADLSTHLELHAPGLFDTLLVRAA